MIGNLMSGLQEANEDEWGGAVSGIQGGHKVAKAEEEDEGLGGCWSAH